MTDHGGVAPLGSPITDAEWRVIEVMRIADSEKDAADRLGLSRHTIHDHLRNARSRCGVPTTRQLLLITTNVV